MNNKIFIFVPINIGRNIEQLLKRKAPNSEFITPTSSGEELKYFNKTLATPIKTDLPELIVSLQPQLLKYFENIELQQHYQDISSGFPTLRQDLQKRNLFSSSSYIKPLLYAPIIMLVNKNIDNPPASWHELLDERFHGRVLAPDIQTPVSIAFNFLMRDLENNNNTEKFLAKMKYSGLPFDVITGVNKGFYDVGLLPLPFARYNIGKNLRTVIPKEGAIILPEMMFLKKNASHTTIDVAHDLFGKNVQRFFSQLGALIPVIEGIPLPTELKTNMNFYWKNWDWYKKLSVDR